MWNKIERYFLSRGEPIWLRIIGVWFLIIVFISLIIFRIEGIWSNLCSEVVGIVITVIVVDKLLEAQKEKEWKRVKDKVNKLVKGIVSISVHFTGSTYGVTNQHYEEYSLAEKKYFGTEKHNWEFKRWILKNVVLPEIENTAKNFSYGDMQHLQKHNEDIIREIKIVLDLFGAHLNSEIMDKIIDVYNSSRNILWLIEYKLQNQRFFNEEPSFSYNQGDFEDLFLALIDLGDIIWETEFNTGAD